MSPPTTSSMLISLLVFVGIIILIVYVLAYRIPKALIKYAVRTYFEEKRLNDLMCAARPGSQPAASAPAYQTGQHGPER